MQGCDKRKHLNGSKRHNIQAVELSQWLQTAMQIVSKPAAPEMGARFSVFWTSRPCGPAGWMALLLIKADDVETNQGSTTTHKQVWICGICHKHIHGRKQISMRCNKIDTGCT